MQTGFAPAARGEQGGGGGVNQEQGGALGKFPNPIEQGMCCAGEATEGGGLILGFYPPARFIARFPIIACQNDKLTQTINNEDKA